MTQPKLPAHSAQYEAIHRNFVARCARLESLLRAAKISFRVTAASRSSLQQAEIYAQGRTTPGPIRTKAKPGTSPHEYDLARDYALFEGGRIVKDANSRAFLTFENLVKKCYLMTGRQFKGLVDAGHVQHPRWKEAVTWKPSK